MKKLLLFLFVSAALLAPAVVRAEERIINFAVNMTVQKDGSAIVEETITVNAEHVKINRGLYRDIPNSAQEPIQFISLYMDNEPHPSFTENPRNMLRINFGDDNYISTGVHTYKLTYSVGNIVRDFDGYDEVYWNVTGDAWAFPIEHASFRISLPEGADIFADKVSTYTGRRGSKESMARQTGAASFETTETLSSGEGFTVAVPFAKGAVQSHKYRPAPTVSPVQIVALIAGGILFIAFLLYLILTWFAVGKDPKDVIVTEFAPPEAISPAFMRSLWERGEDNKMFATALISLAMKNKIEILEEKSIFHKTAVLKLKDKNTDSLFEEEKYILENLLSNGEFKINAANWGKLSHCMNDINEGFQSEKAKYIISNKKYLKLPIIGLVLFQLLLISFGSIAMVTIFINLHYSMFIFSFTALPKNKIFKALVFLALNAFYSPFFFAIIKDAGIALAAVEILFLLSLWAFIIYSNIIDNLTQEGRELFKHIRGFHRYMSIAEEQRVSMSVPVDSEQIFADYLPYAFAFDMENKWMKRFEKSISQSAVDTRLQSIGGRNALLGGLVVSSISSSAPRSSGSGSGGGGSSGGGGGGGGGGGR